MATRQDWGIIGALHTVEGYKRSRLTRLVLDQLEQVLSLALTEAKASSSRSGHDQPLTQEPSTDAKTPDTGCRHICSSKQSIATSNASLCSPKRISPLACSSAMQPLGHCDGQGTDEGALESAIRTFLGRMCDGRLIPTDWLNQVGVRCIKQHRFVVIAISLLLPVYQSGVLTFWSSKYTKLQACQEHSR